jgi:hypothetical protein
MAEEEDLFGGDDDEGLRMDEEEPDDSGLVRLIVLIVLGSMHASASQLQA